MKDDEREEDAAEVDPELVELTDAVGDEGAEAEEGASSPAETVYSMRVTGERSTVVQGATNVTIYAGPSRESVSSEELAAYPASKYFQVCAEQSTWHAAFIAAIVYLPNAPFALMAQQVQALVDLQGRPPSPAETLDKVLAEIGASRTLVEQTNAQSARLHPDGRQEEMRRYIWEDAFQGSSHCMAEVAWRF